MGSRSTANPGYSVGPTVPVEASQSVRHGPPSSRDPAATGLSIVSIYGDSGVRFETRAIHVGQAVENLLKDLVAALR
jgi:hypothetical protein